MIWRQKDDAATDPDRVLTEMRASLAELRSAFTSFRANLTELESEIRRQSAGEEVPDGH